jgi:cytochrome c-type biogenesis protein
LIQQLLSNAGEYVHTNPWLALVAVFLGGVLTATNPCVLAMIPLMMGFVAGRREQGAGPWRAFGYSLTFVLGLDVMFAAMGVLATLAGRLYGDVSGAWRWIAVGVCVAMGLHLMEVVRIPIPGLTRFQPKGGGFAGALLLGLLFGLVSLPCAGPILIVLLTYLASSGASMAWGALLLLVYGLGHGVLVIAAGTSIGFARKMLTSRGLHTTTAWLRRGAGLAIALVGLYLAWEGIAA